MLLTAAPQLKYKGEIKDRVGIWFGLKLVGNGAANSCGESDGSINGNYYMEKGLVNSVIFATVDELTTKSKSGNSTILLRFSFVANYFPNSAIPKFC